MKTVVIFRWWQNDVIALFPEIPADIDGKYCLSYQRMGQHSGADYMGIMQKSRPAKESEYANLLHELTTIGYDLDIRKKLTHKMRQNFLNNLKNL